MTSTSWTDYGHGIVKFENSVAPIDDFMIDAWVEHFCLDQESCYLPFESSPMRFPISEAMLKTNASWLLASFIKKALADCLSTYISIYPEAHQFLKWRADSHIILYGPGTCAEVHSDNAVDSQTEYDGLVCASISASVILSDRCDGGNLGFVSLGREFAPQKGDVFLFPSNYIGAHYVTPIYSGRRISFVEWFGAGHRTQSKEILTIEGIL